MALKFSVIEIFTNEEMRHKGKPLYEAVVEHVKGLKLAARCLVTRATAGCYESGEIASQNILTISYNLPIKIEIVLPAAELDAVLPGVEALVTDGIVAVRPVEVRAYRTRKNLIPRQIKVRDVMTANPRRVGEDTPASEVVDILLPAIFTGLPVVDRAGRPVGIITQGDLIYKAGLPLRLGLLARSDPARRDAAVAALAGKPAREVMTAPAVTVGEDQPVTEAVGRMLTHAVKRLPVVDAKGVLTGMLSRLDIFKAMAGETPHWEAIRRRDVQVGNLRYVSDIMRRDTRKVLPTTPVEDVIRIIGTDDIQRVAVVDEEGRFVGLIADRDLLAAFAGRGHGFWDYLTCRLTRKKQAECSTALRKTLDEKTAADVMVTDLVIVGENTPIEEAVRLMVDKAIKRLPVVDAEGRFRGMISRDALLKTGAGTA